MAGLSVPIVNTTYLAEESAPGLRYDLKSDLLLGLPYSQGHADKLALAISRLLCPPTPKKGSLPISTILCGRAWLAKSGRGRPVGLG